MENQELLKNFTISLIKRFQLDVEFLEGLLKENPHLFDSQNDFLLQCEQAKNNFQTMLDYNFSPDDVENIPPYSIEVTFVKNGDMV